MIRFIGDGEGNAIPDQNTRRPVLFLHSNKDSCLDWITGFTIPEDLFLEGYDVYVGCRRGTFLSDANDNNLSEEDYWDFVTEDVGNEDVTAMIQKVIEVRH